MLNNLKVKLTHLSEMVMFKHSIFSLPFIFIGMLIAADGWFGWKLFFLGIIAAITARNFAMGVNRYLDRDIDILNPRTKNRPSVDGRVSNTTMLGFIVLNGVGFILTAYFVNTLAFQLSFPILLILGGYTVFKRFSSLAHIVLGISLGLAPIAGVVAVSSEITTWSLYLSAGVVFWVAGFDLLYSLQDIAFDKEHGLHSIPAKYGVKNTMNIAKTFHALTIVFWIMFVFSAELTFVSQLAVILSAIMLAYEHYLVNKDFTKIDRAFFTVNGYLGIMFLFLIILEVL
ncbi:MAG: Menaquinone via futalosine polyprenyltransferase (MenA homolog) [uncultured Sulfurovum sp.]|uniref:Menaquinone via futalosine polyprenyltransferase (MenA homolog) n=1 Tax=uncultured Sulfurovum sp. TaxID=269237 RepID=A0A6S6TVR0_9BACT|nr:MAG: Menaquinone via futalosine polyprenyltransferase (MenA homolog) [uncultured Sulfurovum sp.]